MSAHQEITSNACPTSIQPEQQQQQQQPQFSRGDHVYQWCRVAGVPRVFQHHGIVLHVELRKDGTEKLTIADFSNFLPQNRTNDDKNDKKRKKKSFSSGSSSTGEGKGVSTGGILRVYTTSSANNSQAWHKVQYNAPKWKTLFGRSGTCTSVAATDSPEMVLSRVNFLIRQSQRHENDSNFTFQSNVLPKYHLLFANCECVAMWCKTGMFSTLQGASLLTGAAYGTTTVAIGQATAGSAAAVVGTAVEVAAVSEGMTLGASAGLASSAQPWMWTALAAYGALTVGGITGTLLLAKSKWRATTRRLNEALELELASSIAVPE